MPLSKKWTKPIGIVLLLWFLHFQFEYVIGSTAWGILIFRFIYHPLCLVTAYCIFRISGHKGWIMLLYYSFFLVAYSVCYVFYVPDRIEFFFSEITVFDGKLEEKKKIRGVWNESTDVMYVGDCYSTDYPWRVPLIADTKAIVYGPRERVKEIFGIKPESKLVHIYGKWYFYFYENNEMP